MVKEIGHFIGGKHVKGTSGRFADVFNPNTGEVQARVALASPAELRAAVENAKAAQPEWAAKNPQVRARVMMRFLELARIHAEEIATLISMEHGKTIPDALGDLQRGVEVVEFACGIPHLLKGDYTDGAGPGIDMYSMRQPLGIAAGITPFNFPAMIPLWKAAPAIACGNAFILKPSERDPSCSIFMAGLLQQAGLPDGVFSVVQGDKVKDAATGAETTYGALKAQVDFLEARDQATGERLARRAAHQATVEGVLSAGKLIVEAREVREEPTHDRERGLDFDGVGAAVEAPAHDADRGAAHRSHRHHLPRAVHVDHRVDGVRLVVPHHAHGLCDARPVADATAPIARTSPASGHRATAPFWPPAR